MNILYISQSCDPYNGSEDQIGWGIPWEAAKHHRVSVITRTDLRDSIESYLNNNEKRSIKVYYVDIPEIYKTVFKGFFYSGRLLKWNRNVVSLVERLCKEEHFDIIHQLTPIEFRSIGDYGCIPGIKYVCGPLGAGQNIDKPMMQYVHGKNRFIEYSRTWINHFYRLKIKLDGRLNRCDYLLFTNKETYEYLGGDKLGKRAELYYDNGIDRDAILSDDQMNDDLEHNGVHFLVAGRLLYIKGHDFLLDVLETLPEDARYRCRIVGGGPLLEELRKRCESPRLRDKVQVIGAVQYTRMMEEYKWADVLIFPSLRESSGTVILEAMTQAIPIITVNRFGGAVILDENCAWFFDGKDLDAYKGNLRNAILECINHPEKIKEKGKCAKETVATQTWEEKVKHYTEIYEGLIGNSTEE